MSDKKKTLSCRHLLGIEPLILSDIETILELAGDYAKAGHRVKEFDCGYRKLVAANVFLEPSTRTRVSFEMAMHRLGIKPLSFDVASSSLSKGETFMDTIMTIHAMRPDVMIVRQSEAGLLDIIAGQVDCPLINAGDGTGEHPTQALLDALTMIQHKETLVGLHVVLIGDIAHSRVARSNFHLLAKMGANVTAFGPGELMTGELPAGIARASSMAEALEGVDVVMMLRVQLERMDATPTLDGYLASYGLDAGKLKYAKKDAIIMHPGPMNVGIEIAKDLATDTKRAVIMDQVKNGVAVRMAVLDLLTKALRG